MVAVINWYARLVVGYAVDVHSRMESWLKALGKAVLEGCPNGSQDQDVFLISDNGYQPTSRKFRMGAQTYGIKQAFTSYNYPKGNAHTERWFRTLPIDF